VALFDLTTHLLEQAMIGSSRRQSALANNLANANTPGYIRQDVDFQSALEGALEGGADVQGLSFQATADRGAGPVRADGNTVDVDTEMASLNENSLLYQSLVAVQKARFRELETVMRGS
jgi:flagellar basal-body rod protein FlgB